MAFTFSQAKEIPITEYLSRLGYVPAKVRGNDHWYYSPLRNEKDPSFKVNTKLNVWYDHGSGEGGTLLDLGARLNSCSIRDFVALLQSDHQQVQPFSFQRKEDLREEDRLIILSVSPLQNQELISYLNGRGISEKLSKEHCSEVSFRIGNKHYEAIGFENRSGGYELRNSWFKGSSSPKDVSLVQNHGESLCVLEGFIDFLSVKQLLADSRLNLRDNLDFLILNSLSFLKKSLEVIRSYNDVISFLDNDQAGKKAKVELSSLGVNFEDHSSTFHNHKDVNEYLKEVKSRPYLDIQRRRGHRI